MVTAISLMCRWVRAPPALPNTCLRTVNLIERKKGYPQRTKERKVFLLLTGLVVSE